jgi:imidazolonepropionase-like amidohydrolase
MSVIFLVRKTVLILALAAAGACASAPPSADGPDAPAGPLAITHVTVVDVASGSARADQTVVIAGNRIVAAAPAAEVAVPAGARVIDGRGAYLVPGLWDMHTHLTSLGPAALGLNVANGVTGVRDMGAIRFATARAWRDSIAAGLLLGPRMKIAAPVVEHPDWLQAAVRAYDETGASTDWARERFGPYTQDEAIRWVDSVAALGADHVKVRNWPAREVSVALLDRARERGLPVVGHANHPFPRSGLASIEHGIFPPLAGFDVMRDTVFAGYAARGVAVVPTLVTWPGRLLPVDSLFARMDPARTPAYGYVPRAMVEDWRREVAARASESRVDWPAVHRHDLRNLGEMRAAGVVILAGTDAPSIGLVPGFSLHDELSLFVGTLGMSPAEALRTATLRPARFLGLADSLGTVEAGKVADLVLLDADPLADIGNTRRIRAVILDGRYLDRRALDRLLAQARAEAAGP